jgi:hypothetical protein
VDRVTEGPLLVVGSSMGGWIMLHGQRDPDVPWQTALVSPSGCNPTMCTAAIQRPAGSVPAD